MEHSFLHVSEKGLELPNNAPIYGVSERESNSWKWHLAETAKIGSIKLDLSEEEDEVGYTILPPGLTQEELEKLTDEWSSSGSDLDFHEWLKRRNA